MNITVIGAGVFGTAFATAATRAGHQVSITARHPERAEKAAAEAGATAVTGGNATGADVVVLAIPPRPSPTGPGPSVTGWPARSSST